MKQATTRELFAYWDALRGDRLAPERADIDPAAIRGLLGHTFMLEVDSAGRFPFRLCGTHINVIFLRELRSASFFDLWRSCEHTDIAKLLSSLLEDKAPLVVGAATAPSGYLPIDLELLLLPLRHHGKTHARILGSLVPAIQSSWFGLIAAEALVLRSMRVQQEPDNRPITLAARRPELTVANLASTMPSITRYDHLTVYTNSRR